MSRNISIINSTDNFQEWFNITNQLVEAAQASVTIGNDEINTGNVNLNGLFGCTDLYTNSISVQNENSDTIDINNSVAINSDLEYPFKIVTTLDPEALLASGLKQAFVISDFVLWELGPTVNPTTFEIKNNQANYTLQLVTNDDNSSGTLVGTNVKISDDMLPDVITSNINGSATTCESWAQARTVTFASGDVTGSFSINGSADINNIVLTVEDNSHKHTIANIEGLQDALDGKAAQSSDIYNIANLEGFGVLVKSGPAAYSVVTFLPGNGISIDNGAGIGGNPTISHQPGNADLESQDNSESSSKFIKNISVDSFGHISSVSSGDVPLGKSFTSGDITLTTRGTGSLQHSLGSTPSLIKGYLKCTSGEYGFSKNDMIPLDALSSVFVTYGANGTNVFYNMAPTIDIKAYGEGVGGAITLVTLTNSRWKLVLKGWV